MTGAAEHPTNGSPALGTGIFSLDGNNLSFNLRYAGLTATVTMAHIHGPPDTTTNASVLISLVPYNGGAYDTSGSVSGTAPLSYTNLLTLIDGSTYINFHTANNGGGEIRGQISR